MSRLLHYSFRAMGPGGSVVTGSVHAVDSQRAREEVARQHGLVLAVVRTWQIAPSTPGIRDLATGLRGLATLLQSGIGLSRAMAVLPDLAPSGWTSAVRAVETRVQRGEPLGVALAASGLGFPTHVVGVLRAGEATGHLADATMRAAELIEIDADARAAIRSALAYPAMLAVAGTASTALLVGAVLPRFAELLTDAGQALPFSTQIVLGLGKAAGYALVPVSIAALLAVHWFSKRRDDEAFRCSLDQWLATVPAIGPIRRSRATAVACGCLAALLASGVPLSKALGEASEAATDRFMARTLLAARERIRSGEPISRALEGEGAFTAAALKLVRVGEETGDLGSMLAHAGRVEAESAMASTHRLVRFIEPALVVVFGGVVAIVAAALLQAMYGLRPTL